MHKPKELRDELAMAALPVAKAIYGEAMPSYQELMANQFIGKDMPYSGTQVICHLAYYMADVMLDARKKDLSKVMV